MAFDRKYLTPMGYGGDGGNSLWLYHDANADNIASLVGPSVNTAYFSRAVDDHGVKAKKGDLIFISSFNTPATNEATPVIALVPNDWDSNGASVIVGCGFYSLSPT
jgi:hypothetical protein